MENKVVEFWIMYEDEWGHQYLQPVTIQEAQAEMAKIVAEANDEKV